jgi:hypothetical protein
MAPAGILWRHAAASLPSQEPEDQRDIDQDQHPSEQRYEKKPRDFEELPEGGEDEKPWSSG